MAEKIVQVKFLWSENSRVPEKGLVFDGPDAEEKAETLLSQIGWDNRDRPGYDKTKLEVEFESGVIYTGRWDVQAPLKNNVPDNKIRPHIRQVAQTQVNKPGDDDWKKLLEIVGEGD